MRAVKCANTTPELRVRAAVRALGRRYCLGGFNLPGKPDLVFPSRKAVIFVHGCFWHGHDCARGARTPKTNTAYWRAKINRNRARDISTALALTAAGWKVLAVWECETREMDALRHRMGTFLE